ncbi:MAG: PAS domain S-box protein [Nitrospiraceae bacterium]
MIRPESERSFTLLALGIGCAILAGLSLYAMEQRSVQHKERDAVRATRITIEQVDHVFSLLSAAESGQRGYLLTGDVRALAPYHQAEKDLPTAVARLEELCAPLPGAAAKLKDIHSLAETKLRELQDTLRIAATDHLKGMDLVREHVAQQTITRLQEALATLREEQFRALQDTEQRERAAMDRASLFFLLGGIVGLILLGSALVFVWRDTRVIVQAQRLRTQARLVDLAPVMTRTLDGQILSWSEGYSRLTGYRGDVMVGKDFRAYLPAQANAEWETVRAGLIRDGQWSGEVRQQRQDGSEILTTSTLTLVQDSERAAPIVVDVATDITALRQAQAALAERETRLRLLTDNMSQFAWTADAAGSITWFNRRWYEYTGATPEECEGWSWRTLVHPDQRETVLDRLSRSIVAGVVWEDTFQLRGRDGHYRWFLSRAMPIVNANGIVEQWFGTNTDVTDLRTAEMAQRFLAAIVRSSGDAIFSKSVDGRVLSWNAGAERLFGYTAEEIVGRAIELLIPEHLLDEERDLRARVLAGGSESGYSTQRRHKTGDLLDVSLTMSPIRSAQGEIVGTSQVVRDIGERVRAERALAAREAEFRTLVSAIPQLVWACDSDGRCLYMSQQWLDYTGTTLEDNLGIGWLSKLHPDDTEQTGRLWAEAVAKGSPYHAEYRLRGADGTYRWFLARGVPLKDAQGTIVKWFGTTTDISQQRESAEALRQINMLLESRSEALAQANQELEAFSYSVSHDLRAPLRTMNGFAQALLEDYESTLDTTAARYLRTINKGAQQMGQLIDDLLAFSRLSRTKLDKRPVPIRELVENVREQTLADQAGRTIEWVIGDLPVCLVDRATAQQVLANLIGNAIKYTRPRAVARIEIGWQPDDDPAFARLYVKDNGIGFDMQYAGKLFGVFQRLHRAEDFEGTGVGLAIVQRVLHRHGGRIWADSRPNEGSTFWFTLELAT